MVEVLLILIVACIAGIVWYSVTTRRRIAQLQDESRARLDEARIEHDKRVDRLNRKFDDVSQRGHLDFAADMLPVLDALGHALEQSHHNQDTEALREGLEMVDRELASTLSKHGIEKCLPQPGDTFDPTFHEAVTIEETDDSPPGCVVECFRPGYVHGKTVLRSAAVSVTRTCGSEKRTSAKKTSTEISDDDAQEESVHEEPQEEQVKCSQVEASSGTDASSTDVEDVEDVEDDPSTGGTSSSRL